MFAGENAMLSVVRVAPRSRGAIHSHPKEQWGVLLEGRVPEHRGEEMSAMKSVVTGCLLLLWTVSLGAQTASESALIAHSNEFKREVIPSDGWRLCGSRFRQCQFHHDRR